MKSKLDRIIGELSDMYDPNFMTISVFPRSVETYDKIAMKESKGKKEGSNSEEYYFKTKSFSNGDFFVVFHKPTGRL